MTDSGGDKVDAFRKSLDQYLQLLASLQHDRAKDAAEKMQEAKRGNRHQQFCSILAHLSTAERQYMMLAFMLPKGFFQKDNQCKQSYEHIKTEFSKLSATDSSSLLGTLSNQFATFASCRARTMDLYERAFQAGMATSASTQQHPRYGVDILAFAKEFRHLSTVYVDGLSEPCLGTLSQLIRWELDIVSAYLTCSSKIDNCDYHGAMEQICRASDLRHDWLDFVISKRESSKIPSFMAGLGLSLRDHGKQQDLPLFAWITRILREALVAKLSFVFNDALALAAGSPEEHERNKKAKLSADLHTRIATFQRRAEALSVSVVYDASEDCSFRGWPPPPQPSYLLPSLDEKCSGMDLYPAIFCLPEWPHPQSQWPAVVTMLDSIRQRQSTTSAGVDGQDLSVVHFYDAGLDVTFFLARVCPPRLTAVIMFESKRGRNNSHVSALLKDLASVLSCSSALSRLKPGAS